MSEANHYWCLSVCGDLEISLPPPPHTPSSPAPSAVHASVYLGAPAVDSLSRRVCLLSVSLRSSNLITYPTRFVNHATLPSPVHLLHLLHYRFFFFLSFSLFSNLKPQDLPTINIPDTYETVHLPTHHLSFILFLFFFFSLCGRV